MKLLRATFLSIRGLPDITCELADPAGAPQAVSVITGPPSCGKTRMLEALLAAKEVIAPYGPMITGDPWIREGESAAKIELTFLLDPDEQRIAGTSEPQARAEALFNQRICRKEADDGLIAVLERYEHDARFGKIEYFPANRTLPPPGHPHGTIAIEQRLWRMTRDVRKYNFVPRLLLDLASDSAASARFSAALGGLCPTLAYVGPSGGEHLRCFSSHKRAPSQLHELSTSEGDAVILAATATLLRFEKSIVLIDRPENAVSERAMADWIGGVRALASDVQIILATGSEALVASVEPRAVLRLGGS